MIQKAQTLSKKEKFYVAGGCECYQGTTLIATLKNCDSLSKCLVLCQLTENATRIKFEEQYIDIS